VVEPSLAEIFNQLATATVWGSEVWKSFRGTLWAWEPLGSTYWNNTHHFSCFSAGHVVFSLEYNPFMQEWTVTRSDQPEGSMEGLTQQLQAAKV